MINSLTVAGEGCGVKPEFEMGDVGVDKVSWLATGHEDERVRIWDLQTERCATTLLHPAVDGPHDSYSRGVSVTPDWSPRFALHSKWRIACMGFVIRRDAGEVCACEWVRKQSCFLSLQALRFCIKNVEAQQCGGVQQSCCSL
jgi:hypothetical protein